ncbi:monosaccharide ABC transporter substrate-binding protein, CUT2 family [Alkalispirochaeta americana]|uniref:Monosaccharide ABC transporter substrate-binding protein, CUT2 family n=1 Tax=Alkalispirochaeta americana TaxID=159291 RepID=A0A1N6SDG4_9SPIO|nr:sugar-binding protein [Alkalispirochaeta americana]SIQ39173.1 monosaccharide ABC transporter substrate-binding protein, CUT2 family [Alkalispirochaeta americana]
MKRIGLILSALALVAAVSFAGGQGERGGLDIGIAMPETHVERWQQDGAALLAGAQELGYSAEVAYGDADQGRQNQQIQDFITKGARLLIVGNINEGVNAVVREAAYEDIIVIAYDRLITGSDAYDYYITFDNFKVGQFQGQAIVDKLDLDAVGADNPKHITLFAGSPTDNNANFFFDGAMSILRPHIERGALNVVGPAPLRSSDGAFTRIATENWRAEVAKSRMENLLSNDARDVTLDAVLAPNDTLARAIIEALAADAKYDTTEKLPVVTGQDAELASVQSIRDGRQYMTVFKDTRLLAEGAIKLADALLSDRSPSIPGARLDTETYDTGMKVVRSYLLEPINVTRENYREVLIDSGYYSESALR